MDVSKIFLTSDTFFGRKNMVKRRGYSSTDEMNKRMIEIWNEKVSKDDIIYHLGNLVWDPMTSSEVLPKLNGNIFIIKANYDKALEQLPPNVNITILKEQIVEIPELNAVLCHYPLEQWNGKKKGTLHFHGHSLKTLPTDINKMNRINVCCDNWSQAPISLNVIHEIIKEYNELSKEEEK